MLDYYEAHELLNFVAGKSNKNVENLFTPKWTLFLSDVKKATGTKDMYSEVTCIRFIKDALNREMGE